MKEKEISIKEKILVIVSLFNGKSQQQICDEMEIGPLTFNRWREEYGETADQFSQLMNENARLRKMFVDLSIINNVLTQLVEVTKEVKSG